MSEYEYKPKQVNLSWGETFEMAVKSPLEANRRFLTLGDAQNYVDDVDKSATPGVMVTVLSSYIKDVEASYTSGHFICVTDVYTNFTWQTAEGQSESGADTYTLSSSELEGAYYIKSVGDGPNPGELVKISGSGGGSGTEIKKYATLALAETDLSNLEDEDIVVVYGDTASQNKAVYYVSKPAGQNGQLIKLAPSYWFSTKADAQTFAGTCELGTIVSVYNDSTAANNGVYYVVAGENDTRELIKIGSEPIITKPFNVLGVEIGSYSDGDPVTYGELLEDVIKKILTKVIDVRAVAPSATPNNTDFPSGDVEVGENKSFTLGMSYVDGYYESSNKVAYTDAKFNQLNHTNNGKLDAGCDEGTKTYYDGSGTSISNAVTINPVAATTYSYTGTVGYGDSDPLIVAKKNNNEDSDVSIAQGTTPSINLGSFTGKFKIYYGYIAYNSQDDYSNVVANTVDTTTNLNDLANITNGTAGSQCTSTFITGSTVDIGVMESSASYPSMAIIVPQGYAITRTADSFGGDPFTPEQLSEIWTLKKTFSYTHGGTTTQYKLYVMSRQISIKYTKIQVGTVSNNS